MARICFLTNELAPYTWGGCGTLLRSLAQQLLAQGHAVVFLLDVPVEAFTAFDQNSFIRPDLVKAYHMPPLCDDLPQERPGSVGRYTTLARRYHHALSKLSAGEHFDFMEFTDYSGAAAFALAAKIARGTYSQSRIGVRMHNPASSLLALEPHDPLAVEKPLLRGLERQAVDLAETVLINTPGYFSSWESPAFRLLSGEPVTSPPPLLPLPSRTAGRDEAEAILFFGRLNAFKGVDVFLDAALAFMRRNPASTARFLLAGHDSVQPPAGEGSYADSLRARIPRSLAHRFVFLGSIGLDDLLLRLPEVRFAVFPSRLESFCYAAHEVRATATPIIVNDIPAFRDAFVDAESALFFDGSATDLVHGMERLWNDKALADKLAQAPLRQASPPDSVYAQSTARPSWIQAPGTAPRPLTPLVVVLADGSGLGQDTVNAVLGQGLAPSQIIVLAPAAQEPTAFSFLGRLVRPLTIDGDALADQAVRTAEALLLLREGDRPLSDYLPVGLDVLARQPEIAFVAAFAEVFDEAGSWLDCFPLDAGLELLPFLERPSLSRAIMRTTPGVPLFDLFDPLLLTGGETAYLLELAARGGHGLTIPEGLIRRRDETGACWPVASLAYLCDMHRSGGAGREVQRALAQDALWSRESFRTQAVAWEQRFAQCFAQLAQAEQDGSEAWQRVSALDDEIGRLRADLEEGLRRENVLRERLEQQARALDAARAACGAAKEQVARLTERLTVLDRIRQERDSLIERLAVLDGTRQERDALAARLAAVESSWTWKCGIRLALSPPGRLLKRLLDALKL